jgi:hypothetical protein
VPVSGALVLAMASASRPAPQKLRLDLDPRLQASKARPRGTIRPGRAPHGGGRATNLGGLASFPRVHLSAAHARPRQSSTQTASDCTKKGLQEGRVLVLRRRPRVSFPGYHARGRGAARAQGFGTSRHSKRARGAAQRTAIDASASLNPLHSGRPTTIDIVDIYTSR